MAQRPHDNRRPQNRSPHGHSAHGRPNRYNAPSGETVRMGTYTHSADGLLVLKLDAADIPYPNAPVLLDRRTVGRVDEVFGPVDDVYVSVKPADGEDVRGIAEGTVLDGYREKFIPRGRFVGREEVEKRKEERDKGANGRRERPFNKERAFNREKPFNRERPLNKEKPFSRERQQERDGNKNRGRGQERNPDRNWNKGHERNPERDRGHGARDFRNKGRDGK